MGCTRFREFRGLTGSRGQGLKGLVRIQGPVEAAHPTEAAVGAARLAWPSAGSGGVKCRVQRIGAKAIGFCKMGYRISVLEQLQEGSGGGSTKVTLRNPTAILVL